ncbi:MAG: sulfotransferase family 2 domain-containing protein [Parvibaculum sp.]
MKRIGDKERVFFFHLPKTAGSSVTQSLIGQFDLRKRSRRHLAPGGWVLIHDHLAGQKRPKLLRKARKASFVTGHYYRGTYEELADPRRDFLFTFLRSPEERLRSLFRFSRSWDGAFGYDIDPHALRFSEFLDYPVAEHQARVDNMMTRMLGGAYGDRPASEAEWRAMVRRACRMLERMDFVGLTETFDENLHELYEELGAGEPPARTKVNETPATTRKRASADDDTVHSRAAREALSRCIRYDRQVYDYARALAALRKGLRAPSASAQSPQAKTRTRS